MTASLPDNQRTETEATLAQILRLLDLNIDIEQNRDDAEFGLSGREFVYVFDENIFELFFEPNRWGYVVSSFYAKEWASPEQRSSSVWRSFEAQSALIASEYLLSEELPGARRQLLYLTPWHRRELAARVVSLTTDISDNARANIDKVVKEINQKKQLLRAFDQGPSATTPLPHLDQFLKEDLAELRAVTKEETPLRRFQLARLAAKALATSVFSEPLDQLRRVVASPLVDRLRTLNQDFSPRSDEVDEIQIDARMWYYRLKQEIASSKFATSRDRTDRAIWSDAQSMALVRWAATKRARDDQRVVLITGDIPLYNCYRRWYQELNPESKEYYEPFFLRRAAQYAPIFNLSGSRNDMSTPSALKQEARKLFEIITGAVEVALLPFNLSRLRMRSTDHDPGMHRGRHHLALKRFDQDKLAGDRSLIFFTQRLPKDWFGQRKDSILEIGSLWQRIERMAIGAFYEHITKRIEDDRRLFGGALNLSGGPEAGGLLANYISGVLDSLLTQSLDMWVPLAQEFIKDLALPNHDMRGRAPATIWYESPSGDDLGSMFSEFRSSQQAEIDLKNYKDQPEVVFVVASAAAVYAQDWYNAEKFAALAQRANANSKSTELAHNGIFELKFLSALTTRFRIGEFNGHLTSPSSDSDLEVVKGSLATIETMYTAAKALLDECINPPAIIVRAHRDLDAERAHWLRAKSERAALCLFFSTGVSTAGRLLNQPGYIQRAEELVWLAKKDICDCIKSEEVRSPVWKKRLEAVITQYWINSAAAEVVRYIIVGNERYVFDNDLKQHVDRIRSLADAIKDEPIPVLDAEIAAFLILSGDRRAENWVRLEQATSLGKRSSLAIDRSLCREMERRIHKM